MTDRIKAGFYNILECKIFNYDMSKQLEISNMIYRFAISEGIFQRVMQAQLSLYDTLNIVDGFPLLGEERVLLTVEDFYGEQKTYVFHITSIGPVSVGNNGVGQDYTLFLFSTEYVRSEANEIRRSFTGAPHIIAKDIHEEFLQTSKPFDYEFTAGSGTFVIPALTPFEAMDFLSRKAYSSSSESSYFYFFETRDNYMFTTFEKLVKDSYNREVKTYDYVDPKQIGSTPKDSMYQLIDYKNTRRFNVLNEMRSGAQVSRTLVVDLSKKTIEKKIYKHYEELDRTTRATGNTTREYHTDKFNKEYFDEKNVLGSWIVFNDTTKPESYYSDILPRRVAAEYFYNALEVSVTIYGSWEANVGDIIELNIPDPETGSTEQNPHRTLSGRYIVESMNHVMDEDEWKIKMNLIRDALGEAGESNYLSASAG